MKTVMKDMSKRKEARYVVIESVDWNAFGAPRGWYPSLKAAIAAHPEAKPAQGCIKRDGSRNLLK